MPDTKQCSECRQVLPPLSFNAGRSQCRRCRENYRRSWKKKNPHKVRRHRRKYNRRIAIIQRRDRKQYDRINRIPIAMEQLKQWAQSTNRVLMKTDFFRLIPSPPKCEKCPNPARTIGARFCSACRREKDKAREKIRREKDKLKPDYYEKTSARRRKYEYRKYHTDLKYHLTQKMSCAIRHRINGRKNRHVWELLGYSFEQLRDHLLTTMPPGHSWADVISGVLHIDHKKPVSWFNYESVNDPDFKACWSLNNLQLLTAQANLRKNDLFAHV